MTCSPNDACKCKIAHKQELLKDGTDMNVQPAWESGFTGKGVVLTILGTITITTIINIIAMITTIIIIFTRPKPAYGRQGLAGSWGQDTYEVSTF